jgi:ribulose-5-phosphate 4-epimerase/fuculose-1-phosphate aldolase
MRFCYRGSYHGYEGLTDSFSERERIVASLGNNRAQVMPHHGITTVGETAPEAFSLMKEFVGAGAARIQLQTEATGAEVVEIPAEVYERVAAQYEKDDRGRASAEWPAYLRQLDTIDSGYRA